MEGSGRIVAEVIPWYNRQEFEEVYRCLFSDNVFEKQKGVNKVVVWESRAYPALPLGVCVTASLVRAQIHDELVKLKVTSMCQPNDIRLMYCSALIRFSNLVSDRISRRRTPIRVAAARMKIPVWIIDLRNVASHRRMPSVKLLRQGALCCIEWLKENYWQYECDSFFDFLAVEKAGKDNLCLAISSYQSIQFELSNSVLKAIEARKNIMARAKCLRVMKKHLKRDHKEFLSVLLLPGFFLASKSDLASVLHQDESSFFSGDSLEIPESWLKFWMPVLELLFKHNRIQELFESLLECQGESDEIRVRVAAAWCKKFIDLDSLYDTEFVNIPEKIRPTFNWARLMASALKYPSVFAAVLIPPILNRVTPPINPELQKAMLAAAAIHMRATVSPNANLSELSIKSTFTVTDVRKDLQPIPENSPWQLTDPINWANCPLSFKFNPKPTKVNVVVVRAEEKAEAATEQQQEPITPEPSGDNAQCSVETQSTCVDENYTEEMDVESAHAETAEDPDDSIVAYLR